MAVILAIDPGPQFSASIVYGTAKAGTVYEVENHLDNEELAVRIRKVPYWDMVAIEMVASFGLPVGREVFETVLWIGRYLEASRAVPYRLIYRKDVKMHLCNSMRAKDANIRQALIDKFGGKEKAIGSKRQPGPLYNIHGDGWSALAVAVTATETACGD